MERKGVQMAHLKSALANPHISSTTPSLRGQPVVPSQRRHAGRSAIDRCAKGAAPSRVKDRQDFFGSVKNAAVRATAFDGLPSSAVVRKRGRSGVKAPRSSSSARRPRRGTVREVDPMAVDHRRNPLLEQERIRGRAAATP